MLYHLPVFSCTPSLFILPILFPPYVASVPSPLPLSIRCPPVLAMSFSSPLLPALFTPTIVLSQPLPQFPTPPTRFPYSYTTYPSFSSYPISVPFLVSHPIQSLSLPQFLILLQSSYYCPILALVPFFTLIPISLFSPLSLAPVPHTTYSISAPYPPAGASEVLVQVARPSGRTRHRAHTRRHC